MDCWSGAKSSHFNFSRGKKLILDGSRCIYPTISNLKSFEGDSWQNLWSVAKLQVWFFSCLKSYVNELLVWSSHLVSHPTVDSLHT